MPFTSYILISVVATVALLTVIAAFVLVSSRATEIKRRRGLLEEALWARRNYIPLLIELLGSADLPSNKWDIIRLRAGCNLILGTFEEHMHQERELTKLMLDAIEVGDSHEALSNNVAYQSARRDYDQLLEEIRIAVNNYNFAIERYESAVRLPWLKIGELAVSDVPKTPLEGV